MPKVLIIHDAEKLKAELAEYFSADENARFVRRLDMMALLCHGYSTAHVADLFQYNPTTLQRWVHRFNQKGVSGLQEQPGRGRPARLDPARLERLKADLIRPPGHFGYEQAGWSGKLLSHHLHVHYGTSLKTRQCQKLFRRLGFSLQRPRKMPVGGDPAQRAAFKKNS